jgi:hypothetical protein
MLSSQQQLDQLTQAGIQFEFLRGFAEKMGLDVRVAAQSFGFFLGSVKGTNLTLDQSRQIFEGFSTAARALQLSTSDVDGVFPCSRADDVQG